MHRLAIWQPIVPVLVTLISLILKLEKPSLMRYIAITVDMSFVVVVYILRFGWVDEYGENPAHDKKYLIYITLVIVGASI